MSSANGSRAGWQRWAVWTAVAALGVSCSVTGAMRIPGMASSASSASSGGSTSASSGRAAASGPPVGAPKKELRFPNHDMALQYDAAKANPTSFGPVYTYAKAVSDSAQGHLVDSSCGGYCAGGPVKFKPVTELDDNSRVLVDNALPKVDVVISQGNLNDAQMGQAVAIKARLLYFDQRGGEEKTLLDGYVAQHPAAMPVVRRRLEILRDAKDSAGSEAQCTSTRQSMKGASEEERLNVLTMCVSLHPDNKQGHDDTAEYAKFLPGASGDETHLYRGHMIKACLGESDSHDLHCQRICVCNDRPWDKKYTDHCIEVCHGCRDEAAARRKRCGKMPR